MGTLAYKSTVRLENGLIIPAGAAAGKALVSDGSGSATWGRSLIGDIIATALPRVPALTLYCDGSAVLRTTYALLFAAISPSIGVTTVTIAAPGVFTLNGHGFVNGDQVYLTTTGALPTGFTANTLYYIVAVTTNTFELAATRGGAAITTTGTQSGVHTVWACPYGLGDGTTTFNVPDLRGSTPMGDGTNPSASGATAHSMGQRGGEETHTLSSAESGVPAHTHPSGDPGGSGAYLWNRSAVGGALNYATGTGLLATSAATGLNTTANASSAHNTLSPYTGVKWIIYAGA